MRRLSSDPAGNLQTDGGRQINHAATFPASAVHQYHSGDGNPPQPSSAAMFGHGSSNGIDGVYTPPMAHSVSLLQPPPLEPLILKGFSTDTPVSARILTASIAEEIRIMVPERLRIEEDWQLAYSLDQDGASLATLYEKMHKFSEHRIGFVIAVKDKGGGVRLALTAILIFVSNSTNSFLKDIWSLSDRAPTSLSPLFWYWRVLPVEGLSAQSTAATTL